MSYLFDRHTLMRLAECNAPTYPHAAPFPHAVLDDFLPPRTIETVLACFPEPRSTYWYAKHVETSKKLSSPRTDKELLMPEPIRQLMWQLNSAVFLEFLTRLTGMPNLVPDPYLEGGGIHQIENGGYLKIHADFNRHPILDLDRRINVLIYLNYDWKQEYGGDLELWDRDMTACVKSVAPIAGRCVVFNTTDTSYHGHPEPLTCPPPVTRKSIAMYYYSNGRPADERSVVHSTLYQKRPTTD